MIIFVELKYNIFLARMPGLVAHTSPPCELIWICGYYPYGVQLCSLMVHMIAPIWRLACYQICIQCFILVINNNERSDSIWLAIIIYFFDSSSFKANFIPVVLYTVLFFRCGEGFSGNWIGVLGEPFTFRDDFILGHPSCPIVVLFLNLFISLLRIWNFSFIILGVGIQIIKNKGPIVFFKHITMTSSYAQTQENETNRLNKL